MRQRLWQRLREQRARVAAALEWRPEWPVLGVVILAWVILLARAGWPAAPSIVEPGMGSGTPATEGPTRDHGGGHLHPMAGEVGPVTAPSSHGASGGGIEPLGEWGLMAVAMMLPVALPAVGHVGVNSLRRRRPRAMALFVATYVGIWIGFGALVLIGARWLRETAALDGRVLIAGALAMAAAWQLTQFKRRALFQCGQTVPLPPIGPRADIACVRFASLQGWRCLRSCWALMVIMAVVDHAGLVVMAVMTAFIVTEELTRVGRRLFQPSAVVLAFAAGLVAFAA